MVKPGNKLNTDSYSHCTMGVVSGLVGGAVVLVAAALSYGGVLFHQYGDVRVFTDGTGLGRTKNSVAALIGLSPEVMTRRAMSTSILKFLSAWTSPLMVALGRISFTSP